MDAVEFQYTLGVIDDDIDCIRTLFNATNRTDLLPFEAQSRRNELHRIIYHVAYQFSKLHEIVDGKFFGNEQEQRRTVTSPKIVIESI